MSPARRQQQRRSIARWLILAALIGMAVFAYMGWPVGLPLLVCLIGWGLSEPAPELSGPKPAAGGQLPANDVEAARLLVYRAAHKAPQAAFTALFTPGKGIQASWLTALAAGWTLFLLPAPNLTIQLISAVSGAMAVAGLPACWRLGVKAPGVPIVDGWKNGTVRTRVAAITALAAGGFAGWWLGQAALDLPWILAGWGVRSVPDLPATIVWPAAALGGLGAATPVLRVPAQREWRERLEVENWLRPIWLQLKVVPFPQAGPIVHTGPITTTVLSGVSSEQIASLRTKIAALSPGRSIGVAPTPATNKRGPIPGTCHLSELLLAWWDSSEWPDVTDPATTVDMAMLAAGVAIGTAMWGTGILPVPLAAEQVQDEQADTALWRMPLSFVQGAPDQVRYGGVGAQGMTGGQLGGAVLNHRTNPPLLWFGDLDAPSPMGGDVHKARQEDVWNERWQLALGTKKNPPTWQSSLANTVPLDTYTSLSVDAFVLKGGEDIATYTSPETERKLKTAVGVAGAAWLAVLGWTRDSLRAGERSENAILVATAARGSRLPATIQQIRPPLPQTGPLDLGRPADPYLNSPQQWLIGGYLNAAFDALRMARPEVVSVECLTEGRNNIWRVRLHLYGQVTFAQVRATTKLPQILGVDWLRVTEDPEGCTLWVGAKPSQARITDPNLAEQAISLDWEQAWVNAKLTGAGGQAPQLDSSGTLEHNQQVQVLTFSLPAGVDREMISKSLDKLRTNTGLTYIELRPSPDPSQVVLYCCPTDPMPERCGYNTDLSLQLAGVPLGTGVEGEPLVWDFKQTSSLLVSGRMGGGKSVILQDAITGSLLKGMHVWVGDPVKGAADFDYAQPYAQAITTTIPDTEAMVRCVYAEVLRRKDLNAQHGASSIDDLPENIRPAKALLVIDEFNNLITLDAADSKPSDDVEVERERLAVIGLNSSRKAIGMLTGKIVKEARSAGVYTLLAGQQIYADDLKKIGAGNLKSLMAALIIGKASYSVLQGALSQPNEAADLGPVVPPGRGLFETPAHSATAIQTWFEPQPVHAQIVAEHCTPASVKPDLGRFHKQTGTVGPSVSQVGIDEILTETSALDVLDLSDEDWAADTDNQPPADPSLGWGPPEPLDWDTEDEPGPSPPT